MVQEFNVLRCFACNTFQNDQVKKTTKKWYCKICGEKQSVKQVFFTGNGKDCRMHVQALNLEYREQNGRNHQIGTSLQTRICAAGDETAGKVTYPSMQSAEQSAHKNQSSRWEKFTESQPEEIQDEEQPIQNVTTDREYFQGKLMSVRQKNWKLNRGRTKPYSIKKSKQHGRHFGQERNENAIEAETWAHATQKFRNQVGSSSTQSAKVTQLQVKNLQENRGESKWGKFLKPIMNNPISNSDED